MSKKFIIVGHISVDSVAHLRKAYPNYFLDISEFVMVLKKILA